MEILGTTFIVTRTSYFMLEYKKTSRKNLQPSYFLLFYEIQKAGGWGDRGERPYVIFSTSKYQ